MTSEMLRKLEILDAALKRVRQIGFQALSIGDLAKTVGMSKSGLFAHFKSKELMMIMVLDHASQNFTEEVFRPALSAKRGLPRLRTIVENWLLWAGQNHEGGCPILTASVEFDDRPGPVKDRITVHLKQLLSSLEKSCRLAIDEGHFREDIIPRQFIFDLYSIMIGFHIYRRTLDHEEARELFRESFENLIKRSEAL